MALILKRTFEFYYYLIEDLQDPRTQDWFLVKSPIPTAFILVLYLMAIWEWLPKYMENREPFELRRILMCYNLIQIVVAGYLIITGTPSALKLDVRCAPVDYSSEDPDAMNLASLTWIYFMVKIIDLLDTVFFILRKKQNQVSFLHVYHHFGMVVVGWMGTKYIAGGESTFLGFLNSIVHFFMYSYYFYSAWVPNHRDTILGWKKFVTQLQLLQFIILVCLYVPKIFYECAFPKPMLILFVPQNLVMIFMFGDFYYRTYIKRQATPKFKQQGSS